MVERENNHHFGHKDRPFSTFLSSMIFILRAKLMDMEGQRMQMQRIDKLPSPISFETAAPFLFLIMWSSGAVMVKMGLIDASPWTF